MDKVTRRWERRQDRLPIENSKIKALIDKLIGR